MTEEKRKNTDLPHQLTLVNRNQMNLDGVTDLGSYDQEQIILETNCGVMEIKGEQLHIQQLSLEQGKVIIAGEIYSLTYTDQNLAQKNKGFFGKLIK
ncbi:MAG TPA: sporulation protein YabP [Bacillota bacterium]|nr:sporulation protein YabP [Bacillota bacterium]